MEAAYWKGFRDGYHGVHDTPVPNFNRSYERGFVMGMKAKKDNEEKA